MEKNKRIPLIEKDQLLLALRRLNMIIPNQLPILSLYITVGSHRLQLNKTIGFIDEEMEKLYKKIEEMNLDPKLVKKDIERVKEFIEFNIKENAQGLAAFISSFRNIFLTYPINFPFENTIILDYNIYKAPLVRLLSKQPKEVFLVIFPEQSLIYKYSDGKLQEKEPPIFRNRQNREKTEDYLRRVKDIYWPYFRSNDVQSVFLIGKKQLMEGFVKILAKTAVQKIKEKIELKSTAKIKHIEKIAQDLTKKYNILNPKDKVQYARKLAQRRMAVFGPEYVFNSLREGNVKELLIEPSFKPKGYRCKRCGQIGIGKRNECPWCKGAVKQLKNLNTAIKKSAAEYDVTITRVKHQFLKKEGKGIAAILRFS